MNSKSLIVFTLPIQFRTMCLKRSASFCLWLVQLFRSHGLAGCFSCVRHTWIQVKAFPSPFLHSQPTFWKAGAEGERGALQWVRSASHWSQWQHSHHFNGTGLHPISFFSQLEGAQKLIPSNCMLTFILILLWPLVTSTVVGLLIIYCQTFWKKAV